MIFDLNKTVSYICPVCFEFHAEKVNLLSIQKGEKRKIICSCGASEAVIVRNQSFSVTLPCFVCGNEHHYKIDLTDKAGQVLKLFTCLYYGFDVLAIGTSGNVMGWIAEYGEELKSYLNDIMDSDDQLILDVLDKISNLDENGKLLCACQECTPKVIVGEDFVSVKCSICNCEAVIDAGTEEKCKQILALDELVLSKVSSDNVKNKLYIISKD